MRFISQNTCLPVPRVICAFGYRDCSYIVVERIKGEMIGIGWVNRSEESTTKLLTQLKNMVREMRELRPPEGIGASSVSGGPLFDCHLPGTSLRFGPFCSIQSFHRYLTGVMDFDPGLNCEIRDLIREHDRGWPIVFTHGDLSSLNILVCGGNIVSIIDWETAGWYPSYWEYTTACQVNWINEVDEFLTPMPEELKMEEKKKNWSKILQRCI